jgi:hydrogenase maturation protease
MTKQGGTEAASASIRNQAKSVLILGIGNILLRDEGIGVRVVEALRSADWPDDVEIIDGGTAGANLVELMADRQKMIVVDAMDAQVAPGTVLRLEGDELLPEPHAAVSLHQLALVDSLAIANLLGCAPREVIVVGVQPGQIRPGLELSPEVERAIPIAIDAVRREVQHFLATPIATHVLDGPSARGK